MQMVKLKDICIGKGEYGIAASAESFSSNKYRYLRITDISDFGELLDTDCKSVSCDGCEKYLLNDDEIVFARTGNSTGRAFFYEKKYGPLVYAGFLIKFHLDRNKVNPKYLKYYTISKTYTDWIANGHTGSTRGNLYEGDFADMPVFLPSRQAQDALVAMMEPIDEKIVNNNAICSNLEGMAKLLYDYWFVQFDFPDENGKPYKSSGGKMVWNEELKREIPAGWEVKAISDIATLEQNSILPEEGTIYHHYSIPAFDDGKHPVIEYGEDIVSNKNVIPANTVLVSKLNPQFKRIWLVMKPQENAICSTEFLPIKAGSVGIHYLYELFNSDEFSVHLRQKASSSTGSRKRIDPENCMSFQFAFDKDIAKLFSSKIASCIERTTQLPLDNQQLASLRDFLLPMLMNGQVKVNTAEA